MTVCFPDILKSESKTLGNEPLYERLFFFFRYGYGLLILWRWKDTSALNHAPQIYLQISCASSVCLFTCLCLEERQHRRIFSFSIFQ